MTVVAWVFCPLLLLLAFWCLNRGLRGLYQPHRAQGATDSRRWWRRWMGRGEVGADLEQRWGPEELTVPAAPPRFGAREATGPHR
jgi:hypothetical protein